MSIESALIAQAQPYIAAVSAREIIKKEICKGCTPEISSSPVSLEPCFVPLWTIKNRFPEPPADLSRFQRLQVWISPEQKFDWNTAELFIEHLQILKYHIAFEVTGKISPF